MAKAVAHDRNQPRKQGLPAGEGRSGL